MSSSARPRELADGKLLLDEPAGAVLQLTICNPTKRNALDHPILDAITDTLRRLATESDTRCVVITGAQGMFSAGYDIGEIPEEEFQERADAREQQKRHELEPYVAAALGRMAPLESTGEVPAVDAYPRLWSRDGTAAPELAPDRRPGMAALWQRQVGGPCRGENP